jgi:hypothetical protein
MVMEFLEHLELPHSRSVLVRRVAILVFGLEQTQQHQAREIMHFYMIAMQAKGRL